MRQILKGGRVVRTFITISGLIFAAGLFLFPGHVFANDCSPYIGDMTINELYELGNEFWVEVRLLDTSVAKSVYDQWSIQVCEIKGNCTSYPLSAGNVFYPETYPDWITLKVDKKNVNLQQNGGMDIVLRDQNGKAIDYLSVNNFNSHQPNCAAFLYPTTANNLSSAPKGIYRDPDGTGPWVELGSPGATGEPTTGYDNNDKGLVVYYALEGDVTDSSLNGNNGSSYGTVAYQHAKICDGVQLNGNGYLKVPDGNDLDLKDALTVMAWIHPDSLSISGHDNLYSLLSKDANYEFHVQRNGSLYWWWGNGSFSTGTGVIPVQAWSHIAFVYSKSAGTMQIFVNGQLVASHSYSASLPVNSSPFLIGADIATGGGELANRRFYGSIDEVRIYDRALTGQQIAILKNQTDPCGAVIDHLEIVHDGSALTCVPEAVTVRACADAACNTLYTGNVEITLSPSGWVGGNVKTLTGGSGVFRLRHTTPGTVTLSVSSDPASVNGSQCVDGAGGSSCSLVFREAGFVFDVPDVTSCTSQDNILIAAVRADATAEHCVGDDSFAGTTRNVGFWSSYQEPVTGTQAVSVNGTAITHASPGQPVQLSFNNQAQSLLSVRYSDAGRVRLSARFAGTGDEADLVMLGSDSFVAAPHHLRVRATTDGTTLLNNATTSGDPHWPAGENFSVEVAGVCSNGTVTPNFAASTTLSASAGNPSAGVVTGGPFAAGDYSAGVVSGTASYSEVGTVTLQAQAANYLGSGIDVTGSTTAGRFTPHHFTASPNSPLFATACSVGGFTYVGQAFDYALAPSIMVTAQNKQGGTTANYTGAWWRITNGSLSGKTYSAAKGTLDLTNIPAVDPVISDSGGGLGVLTFDAGSGLSFTRGVPVAPFDADIRLSINVLDADGIAATTNPVTFGAATAGNGISFDHGKTMRWGRVSLKNAYGSELLPLSMPLRAEYFDGTSFVKNTGDGCTALALTQLVLKSGTTTVTGDQPVAVGSGSSQAALGHIPMLAGDAGLIFSAPGSNGYIQVRADLTLLPWLRYDWDGDGSHDDDPTARASFGIYKGRPGMIYMRESFR